MRWADMDMLGHVNNVTYLDYLQEARIDLFATHDAFRGRLERTEGVVVVDYQVEFLAPLVFRRRPVSVDIWVSDVRTASFRMHYEVYDGNPEARTVYLRASSTMTPLVFETRRPRRLTDDERELLAELTEETPQRESIASPTPAATTSVPIKVRFTDLDMFGHVNNVQFFELFQEARIAYLMDLHTKGEAWAAHVVARTDIDYRQSIRLRRKPYDVHNWISRLGSRSFTISSQIRDGDEVLATAHVVMVTFDESTQRSTEMPADQRRALAALVQSSS